MAVNKPSKKKRPFPINEQFWTYLEHYNRKVQLPVQYEDMHRYSIATNLYNSKGEDTLWQTVYYPELDRAELYAGLTKIYALLKMDGDFDALKHLSVARIDFCTFGNTQPFRVRIINRYNDNYDHFYVKRADASRVYGLELEDMLSPNSITYLVYGNTLIEEHIAGIPGDDFMKQYLDTSELNKIRIAKEFVKFNERCFVRLLGDMRAYNYVVDITPDIEGLQYRIRAIDFDQQSYEGWKSFYLPQYFKENNPIIFLGIKHLNDNSVTQYQLEERTLIGARAKATAKQLNRLLEVMMEDELSHGEKISQLRQELAYHHQNNSFLKCDSMGEIVVNNIKLLLSKEFHPSIMSG